MLMQHVVAVLSSLPWISNADFDWCIERLLQQINAAYDHSERRISANVQDPFLLLCLAYLHRARTKNELLNMQKIASVSSGTSSAIGRFHQNILGRVAGFVDHDAGYDLESPARKILAEIKNKHNTMNASNRMKVIEDLKTATRMKPGFTGYLVIMVPKKPEKYQTVLAPRVYETDGTSFYELVTGCDTALKDLYGLVAMRLCENTPDIRAHCLSVFSAGMAEQGKNIDQ